MDAYEVNFDGLVGPTHNYAGLSVGNIASQSHAHTQSNPQAAALQGLAKMRLLHSMGIKQGILVPQQRPNLLLLHQLGFTGTPAQQIQKAHKTAPELLAAAFSAASMWTANAATIAPSTDTADGKLHCTAANLVTNIHRQQETKFTQTLLQTIFSDMDYFTHHDPLPCSDTIKDEGAANHNRLCKTHGQPGVQIFVYNKSLRNTLAPQKYPARQTYEACVSLARLHLLPEEKVVFAQQDPVVVDLGVFHNDVIAVANESVLLVHEHAFINQNQILEQIRKTCAFPVTIIEIKEQDLSVKDAVATYFFNSQLITKPGTREMFLLAPKECQQAPTVKALIDNILADSNNPVQQVHYVDIKQSMQNGGGPACLRLRVVMNDSELTAMHQGFLITDALLTKLESWVKKYYRTHLQADDLLDPLLIDESLQALDALTTLLGIDPIYPFQLENTPL